jgi:putative ABC transport system permease protein
MRALGAARSDIFRLFWLETIQVATAGSFIGIILAFAASRTVEAWLRAQLPFAPTDPLIQWQWAVVAACFACALVLGSLAGFLPAWRAARLSPMTAMHTYGGNL